MTRLAPHKLFLRLQTRVADVLAQPEADFGFSLVVVFAIFIPYCTVGIVCAWVTESMI